jgi:hypothetical protein
LSIQFRVSVVFFTMDFLPPKTLIPVADALMLGGAGGSVQY